MNPKTKKTLTTLITALVVVAGLVFLFIDIMDNGLGRHGGKKLFAIFGQIIKIVNNYLEKVISFHINFFMRFDYEIQCLVDYILSIDRPIHQAFVDVVLIDRQCFTRIT